ncbi:TPA: hypothetical protein N0F65_011968 [Lagenidium giganteum]|uniref:Glucosidase II subunit alpha n=1 Tax=Lagenidium giganteum TaxID=4803 RepID=A0AAV2Z8G6_9STRA|nr:TPA: hypothetical protein N0F65_011968 [Lagenidium giganteum]
MLKNTVETKEGEEPKVLTDPYRLYNLDVFEYELDVPMTLYGSIPVLVAPDAKSTVGVFWHNPSETFVDIETKADGSKKSHWLSESGVLDLFFLVDSDYYVHKEATELGLYVKDEQGKDFDGWCWPGSSSYVDFTSLKARRWWSGLFRYEKYEGSTKHLYTWNDMNEPSVFNGPEVSMRKGCSNLDGVEHREWHNLYGYYLQQASMEGQLVRQLPHALTEKDADIPVTSSMVRPFVLSRAFYAGSQRFGAIWTGDNTAEWGHLKYATKMLLSMSVAGLTFVGADVGGFFGNPDTELLTRWYQAATLQPFFRGHAHHDSNRREPWLFGEPHTSRLRDAIRTRYALLPYIYTLFQACSAKGLPVMRPLWMHFAQNPESFTEEDEFLLGQDLLVKPITSAGVTETSVFLPGDVWYAVFDGYKRYVGGKTHDAVPAPLEYSPVFQRGGSVLPRKNRVRRSSVLMKNDPLTLVVALDSKSQAHGSLYLDDEQSFAYEKDSAFTQVQYAVDRDGMTSTIVHKQFVSAVWIERVEIVGFQGKTPSRVLLADQTPLETQYDAVRDVLVVRKPGVLAADAWTLHFQW